MHELLSTAVDGQALEIVAYWLSTVGLIQLLCGAHQELPVSITYLMLAYCFGLAACKTPGGVPVLALMLCLSNLSVVTLLSVSLQPFRVFCVFFDFFASKNRTACKRINSSESVAGGPGTNGTTLNGTGMAERMEGLVISDGEPGGGPGCALGRDAAATDEGGRGGDVVVALPVLASAAEKAVPDRAGAPAEGLGNQVTEKLEEEEGKDKAQDVHGQKHSAQQDGTVQPAVQDHGDGTLGGSTGSPRESLSPLPDGVGRHLTQDGTVMYSM